METAIVYKESEKIQRVNGKQICSRGIYDESVPAIYFDENGV